MFICRFVSGFAYKFLIQTFKRQNAKLFWNKAKTVQDMLRNNVCQKAYSESRGENICYGYYVILSIAKDTFIEINISLQTQEELCFMINII